MRDDWLVTVEGRPDDARSPAPDGDEAAEAAVGELTSPGRGRLFVAGVLTGLAGLATSQVATAVLGQQSGPLVAVAAVIRDATPGSIAIPLIHLVKGLDKPLLVAGTTLGLLLLAGVAGMQFIRRPWLSYLIFAAMGGLGLLAVMHRADSGPYDFLPLLVGFATWVLLIGWLTAPRVTAQGDRRGFLLRGGLAVLGTAAAVGLGEVLGRGRRRVEDARSLLRLPVTKGAVPRAPTLACRRRLPGGRRTRPSTRSTRPSRCPRSRLTSGRSAFTAWSTASSRSPTTTSCDAGSRRPGSRSAVCRTSSAAA